MTELSAPFAPDWVSPPGDTITVSAMGSGIPDELLHPLVKYFNPVQVILFGSRARGDARADSDIDLLIVVDDDAPSEILHCKARSEARRDYKGPVDLLTCRRSTFQNRQRIVGSFAHVIADEGIVVYERS